MVKYGHCKRRIDMSISLIEQVKREADIVSVVSHYTELRHKNGQNYVGLCPLHSDRNIGSFVVNAAKNYCSCWACGYTAMNPIDFVMKAERCDCLTAAKKIQRMLNITDFSEVKRRVPAEDKREVIALPYRLIDISVKNRQKSSFVKWLKTLRWNAEQRGRLNDTLDEYRVGWFETRNHDEFTCFWQIDSENKIRSGKLMVYTADGHRDRCAHPYMAKGERKYHFQDFVHTQFTSDYPSDKFKYEPCLFGEHLIGIYPESRINIVESEKTAIIAAIYFGDFRNNIWVATGGKSYLRKCLPYLNGLGRDVYVYPDKDGVSEWESYVEVYGKSTEIRINYDYVSRYWSESDGAKADVADVLLRYL